jgi:hypothetical protein
MLRFHTSLFARPDGIMPGPEVALRDQYMKTLRGADCGPPLFKTLLPVTFEAAQEQLLTIPRMDVEPDGYFLVASEEGGQRWQIDGQLHELGDRLQRVEMHGTCPENVLDLLLSAFGWPRVELVFELVQEGVTISEKDFRIWSRSNL